MSFDWVYLHLIVNHLPVVLILVGSAAGVVALITKREGVWAYAAVTILLAAVLAPAALLSGQQAEDEAEEAWYASRSAIHEHEEAGEKGMWLTVAAGVLAIVALRRKTPPWRIALAVLALVAAAAMGYAAFEGGKIVHNNPNLEKAAASGITP